MNELELQIPTLQHKITAENLKSDNIPSIKTIEKCGGILSETKRYTDGQLINIPDSEEKLMNIYWIVVRQRGTAQRDTKFEKEKKKQYICAMRKIVIITLSFCLFTQANCSGQNRIANERMTMDSSEIVITTAEKLIAEFSKSVELATEKYTGKTLQITGEIFERASPKDNIPETNASYIVFGNWKDGSVYIQCYFDAVVSFSLQKGDTITITGNFVRFENLKDIMKRVNKNEIRDS